MSFYELFYWTSLDLRSIMYSYAFSFYDIIDKTMLIKQGFGIRKEVWKTTKIRFCYVVQNV